MHLLIDLVGHIETGVPCRSFANPDYQVVVDAVSVGIRAVWGIELRIFPGA